ncbi:MAG: phosphatase PAP2 family protein [Streptosporangiaceae bacterium]
MLLPGPLRAPAAVLLSVCAAVTVPLAVVFAGHTRPSRLDAAVDPALWSSLGRLTVLLNVSNAAGLAVPVSLMTLALTVACLVTRRWSGAVLAALATPVASALTELVLKPLVGRTIGGYDSFPSGHATVMFALAATCSVLLLDPPGHRVPAAVRLLLACLALLAATTVSLAMVAANAHYFTDVVAGAALGTAVVLACALTLDGLAVARWRVA